jgi:hypothetical protein
LFREFSNRKNDKLTLSPGSLPHWGERAEVEGIKSPLTCILSLIMGEKIRTRDIGEPRRIGI